MGISSRKRKKLLKKEKPKNNRVNLVIAIIFLLAGGIIYRLYYLQVNGYESYSAMAAAQHEISRTLESSRGKIFIQDQAEAGKSELFPLVTNKEYGLVYIQPNLIRDEDMQFTADSIYSALYPDSSSKKANTSSTPYFNAGTSTQQTEEAVPARNSLIDGYLKKMQRRDDPYEPIEKKVSEGSLKRLEELKLAGVGVMPEVYRYYPEKNIGSHITGFLGYSGDERKGRYGLEEFFNEELSGKTGHIKTERDAKGNWIIVNGMQYDKPVDGSDLILTINRSVQFFTCEKLKEYVVKHGADKGSVIIMEPDSGAILAMCSYPDFDPNSYADAKDPKIYNNPAIFEQYEPGSVFKALTMSAALDQGKVSPETTYKDSGLVTINKWTIKNSDFEVNGGHGLIDMKKVLELSLNTGSIFAMERAGPDVFAQYVQKFGFGEKTGIELGGESKGDIGELKKRNIKEIYAATASFGQGITVTPIQMVSSFAALANGGNLMKPYVVKEIVRPDGKRETTSEIKLRRVISERTAALISGMLVNAVENGHAKRAQIKGFYVAGKTGTAQVASDTNKGYSEKTIHSFIGFSPANDPKFVMITKLDNPRSARFAESTAVPLFGEIGQYLVNYLQLEAERDDDSKEAKKN